MKQIAQLLLLWIFLLNTAPAVANMLSVVQKKEHCITSCCEKKHTSHTDKNQKKDNRGNCCDNGICTSGNCCVCCFYFNEHELSMRFAEQKNKTAPFVHKNENAVSSYLSNNWQPPRAV